MGQFKYRALDAAGKRKEGIVSGASKDVARSQLSRMRLKVISIQEVTLDEDGNDVSGKAFLGGMIRFDSKGNFSFGTAKEKAVADKDLIVFTKQLATMISSGVPLNQSLEILSKQQKNASFGLTIGKIRKGIEEGMNFSASLGRFGVTFDTLYISMVRAGEESGKLAEILEKLVVYIEKSAKIKSQIKGAMFYPAVILLVAVVVVSGLLIFVVPSFTSQFKDSGKALPGLTQFVIDLSDFLGANWYLIIAACVVAGFIFRRWAKTDVGRTQVDAISLKAPVIGDLMRKIAVGRFCSTMASMLSAGVNLLPALGICAASSGNVVIEKFILSVRAKIEQGQLLSQPLSENPIFPLMVVSMIQIGEKSGKVDEMLVKVSEFYEEEVDEAVKTMLGLIEPIMIVCIGSVVGVLVTAMYLPIMDLGSVAGG